MKYVVLKYLNLAVLLAFEAWFLWPYNSSWSFEWEPLIGLLVAFISFVGIDAQEHHANSSSEDSDAPGASRVDLELFNELSQLFPAGAIAFFRDHDFHNAFNPRSIKNLFHYVDHWTTAEHEFIDTELEREHERFREKAIALASGLAEYTVSNSHGLASVAPSGHQGGPLPEWAREEAKKLNALAVDFTEAHQEFFRKTRIYFHSAGLL